MFERFSVDARRAVAHAVDEARLVGDAHVTPAHFLLALATMDDPLGEALRQAGIDPAALRDRLRGDRPAPAKVPRPLSRSEEAELVRSMRARGIPRRSIPQIVARIQRDRALGPAELDERSRSLLATAVQIAGDGDVETHHLLAAVLRCDGLVLPPDVPAEALQRLTHPR